MSNHIHLSLILSLLSSLLFANLPCLARSDTGVMRSALFTVTTDIVNTVEPFTATINGFGNSLIREGSGFEPVIFRNNITATQDSPDTIYAMPSEISHYDSFREGFFDGAGVHIYRIENGRFRMVRKDRVSPSGSHASGWIPILKGNKVIAPGTTRFNFNWAKWNRPNTKYYFTVRAIDKFGNLSPSTSTLEIISPKKLKKLSKTKNTLISFKKRKIFFTQPKPLQKLKNLRYNLNSEGMLTLEWTPIEHSDLAGYIIYRSDHPPDKHKGYYLRLDNSPKDLTEHIKVGDMVIISKKIYSPSRKHHISNRIWNSYRSYKVILPGLVNYFPDEAPELTWSLTPHNPSTPVTEPGETYLKLQLAEGKKESLTIYNHSGTKQTWYDVLEKKPYTIEVWMRKKGDGTVRFKLKGFYGKGTQKIKPISFNVGKYWKKYTAYFTPTEIYHGKKPLKMELEFTGPGTFDIDNFRVYRKDTPYLNMLPEDISAIKASGMSALRTHGLIKTGMRTYDIEQLTNSGGVISGTKKLNTLPQILMTMRKALVQPWLQIEYHLSPQEWLNFIEYIAAPYDPNIDTPRRKPWAYKRYSQGQQKPWSDEFKQIYFELSNETWNRLFRPWTFSAMTDAVTEERYSPGKVYGLFQEYVISIMRSSPYWKSGDLNKKFKFIIGGWSGQINYSKNAAMISPSTNYLTIAGYNGGWDEGERLPKLNSSSIFNTLAQVNQTALPVAEKYKIALSELKSKGSHKLNIGTYEAGPGYVMNGLNRARVTKEQAYEQELVMKSLAAGTATLDSFLARAYNGYTLQNFFTFDRGTLWKSHAKWYQGGQSYPSWKLLALFNKEAAGEMLRTETMSVPSIDLKAFSRRKAVKEAPLVTIYATQKNDRLSLFIISRKIPNYPVSDDDGYTPVKVKLPFNDAKSITLYRMTGKPETNNILRDNVVIEKLQILPSKVKQNLVLNRLTGADERGLPPASTFLYIFDGISK